MTHLTDLASKWLKDCSSIDEVRDTIAKEQLPATLPEDVRVWVSERKPKTSAAAGQLAEDCLQAHGSSGAPTQVQERDEIGATPTE